MIPAGTLTTTIIVTVNDDSLDENDETVVVTMDTPTNATLGATSVHTATITDNDPEPTVDFDSNSYSVWIICINIRRVLTDVTFVN